MYSFSWFRTQVAVAVCCLISAVPARADLVISNSTTPNIAFAGSVDLSLGTDSQSDAISSLSQSNSLSTLFTAGSSYSLWQSSGLTDISLSTNIDFSSPSGAGGIPEFALTGLRLEFTPTVNEEYSISETWNEGVPASLAFSSGTLIDLTTNTALYNYTSYHDFFGQANFQMPASTTGTLLAGHTYYLAVTSILGNYPFGGQGQGSAQGWFDFFTAPPGGNPFTADFSPTVAAVPEPTSLALAGIGMLGLLVAVRRRVRA